MKKTTRTVLMLAIVCSLFSVTALLAQGDKASRPSPPATATGKVGAATIKVAYSSPSVKGRKIWGDLVPYGKVWRAGANEATIFETDKAIKVEGKDLPAGKYSLFVLPGEKEATVIFNSETGQWGIKQDGNANLDRSKDVLSVAVKPVKSSAKTEKLAYVVNNKGIALKWDNMEIPVAIK